MPCQWGPPFVDCVGDACLTSGIFSGGGPPGCKLPDEDMFLAGAWYIILGIIVLLVGSFFINFWQMKMGLNGLDSLSQELEKLRVASTDVLPSRGDLSKPLLRTSLRKISLAMQTKVDLEVANLGSGTIGIKFVVRVPARKVGKDRVVVLCGLPREEPVRMQKDDKDPSVWQASVNIPFESFREPQQATTKLPQLHCVEYRYAIASNSPSLLIKEEERGELRQLTRGEALACQRSQVNDLKYREKKGYRYRVRTPYSAKVNEVAMSAGVQHWCSVCKSGLGNSWFPRVHYDTLLGVGLPLYYNAHVLPLSAALFAWLVVTPSESDAYSDYLRASSTGHEIDRETRVNFAHETYVALCMLYSFMLVSAWFFAWTQRLFILWFDQNHSTTQDFVLKLEGLPRSAVNEKAVVEMLQDASKEASGFSEEDVVGISIAYALGDLYDVVTPLFNEVLMRSEQELLNINGGRTEEEDDMHNESSEKFTNEVLPKLRCSGTAFLTFSTKLVCDRVRNERRGIWLRREVQLDISELKDSLVMAAAGHWHVLAKRVHATEIQEGCQAIADHDDRDELPAGTRICDEHGEIRAKLDAQYVAAADGKEVVTVEVEQLVTIDSIVYEAPAAQWWNFGMSTPAEKEMGVARSIFLTLCTFALIYAIWYYPWATYIIGPYADHTGGPGFWTCQFGGWVFGIAGNITGSVMWISMWNIGYDNQMDLDLGVFTFAIATSILQNILSLYISLRHEFPADVTQLDLEAETAMSQAFVQMLIPGWLFTPVIMGQVMGTFIPFAINFLLMRIIFVWQPFPGWVNAILTSFVPGNPSVAEPLRISNRAAEIALEPQGLCLPWDYPGLIVVTSQCIVALFFLSPSMWDIFPYLLGYTVFIYLWHRIICLKFKRKQMHSSVATHRSFVRWWAVPLSLVGTAAAFCQYRVKEIPFFIVPFTFGSSAAMYLLGLRVIGEANAVEVADVLDATYDRVEQKLLYSFFNTNPINVLKAHYCVEHLEEKVTTRSRVPFLYGKEHLIEMDMKQRGEQRGDIDLMIRPDWETSLKEVAKKACTELERFMFWWVVAVPLFKAWVRTRFPDFAGRLSASANRRP